MNAPVEEAEAHAKVSVRENRVYAGNLSYSTTYKDLEKFCQQGGWIWISLDVDDWIGQGGGQVWASEDGGKSRLPWLVMDGRSSAGLANSTSGSRSFTAVQG